MRGEIKQQIISQYAKGSSFMVRKNKQYIYIYELVRLLKIFNEASRIEIN